MIIKKLIHQGNGTAIYLPPDTLRHLGVKRGDYVVLRPTHAGQLIIERLEQYLATRDAPRNTPTR